MPRLRKLSEALLTSYHKHPNSIPRLMRGIFVLSRFSGYRDMELSELEELRNEPTKLISKLDKLTPVLDEAAIKWQPEQHGVMEVSTRPKRAVEVKTGLVDGKNEPIYKTEYEEVSRIPSSTNKQIVDWAVQMALGVPVEYIADPLTDIDRTMYQMVQKTIKANKMEYLDQEIERKKLIYNYAMEVWYAEDAPEGFWTGIADGVKLRMRCVVLSPEDGDIIIPIRDQFKDLISVARKFKVNIDDKDVDKIELFMPDKITTFIQDTGGWKAEKEVSLIYGKLNLVLHEQARRETQDVEIKLNRRETVDSDTSDENMASGRPILAAWGQIQKVGKRADTGKIFQLDGKEANMKYIERTGAQDAIEKERKNLLKDIYLESKTPDPSIFDESAGTNTPGITIKLRFMPAILKAKSKQQGALGMAHQRRINFLKTAMATINIRVKPALALEITPKFDIYLPENEVETVDKYVKLVTAGLMSKETAVKQMKLVDKPDEEIVRINAELDRAQKKALING